MLTMKILLAKICILTFVIVPAVWTATTATSRSTPAITTTAAATAATTLTITNDSNSSHAPNGATMGEMNRNERVAKTLAEIQIGLVGATLTTTTTTSTATPTTTATTSTTTTTAPTGAAAATSIVNGNEAGRQISNGNAEIPATTAATTTDAAAAATKTVTTTTTTATPEREATTDGATTATDKLMTTNVAPLASLGSVFDRLYRIKITESGQESETETETESDNFELDADQDSDGDTSASRLQIQMQAAESYQVAETLADLNEDERKRYGALLAQQPVASKLNIVDLYPLQLQEFQPNDEQLHTVFTRPDNADEYRQNLMPNEVEMQAVVNQLTTKTPTANPRTTTTTTSTTATPLITTTGSVATTPSYFTGKLLAEQDDLITEIERKFQLQETTTTAAVATPTPTPIPTTTTSRESLPRLAPGDSFIDRRVKKSFEFPMQHRASDVMAMPHIDFANTKFNTDANDNPNAKTNSMAAPAAQAAASASHPEFSTTKFYNSKEMYNEMLLLHKKHNLMKEIATTAASPSISSISSDSIIKSSRTTASTSGEGLQTLEQQRQRQLIRASETTKLDGSSTSTSTSTSTTPPTRRVTLMSTEQSFDGATTATTLTSSPSSTATTTSTPTTTAATATATVKPRKYEKELKRAKLLLKALTPPIVDQQQQQPPQFEQLEVVAAKVKITATASTPSPNMERAAHQAANLTKSPSKPIARPRILSRLQEKINSLECDIQNVPQDSHLWRGNETHELLLPIVTTEHCKPGEHCAPNFLTWEGEAEIQSGDILIVEINDAMLNTAITQNSTNSQSAAHAAQVYQVTRSGHEHCDVTEGVLLDITPLVVDGRKLVTLYDKDLTEGVNLLIVVSELWGAQCVRLKVTTKTDNCGENADCSGKGICYSNGIMEEYECQCCGGFAGPHCEEIDACNPSPCTNNGICVDLSQGHEGNSYQCLCPYGYAGKNCQYESDPCNPAECMNGGSCLGNSTHFRCDCTPGYTGAVCQHSLNECESSPCVHGICVDQEDGFRCFCQPGFAGELCNFEYNECESNPCQNNGECIDHIGSYECRCTKGYLGNRCQMKVDFCANKPCPEGHRCIDHGNDFSCECPEGRNGPDCNQMPRTYFQQCSVNPCTHGGTCWSSGDSFYCACRPGYTGTMCEDEFVVETVVSSSEFIVDDVNARNFNDKTFGSSAVLKSPIELHNAYFAAGALAAAIFIVAVVVTVCHCNVNQTYRKFSTRSSSFIPILGFSRRPKLQGALNKHWLSGKGLNAPAAQRDATSATSAASASASAASAGSNSQTVQSTRHLPSKPNGSSSQNQTTLGGQLQERPFQRHLAMNFENDMYYTVDFAENTQNSPLIQ